jgi:long-chain acyl-CoA synthetase
MDRYWDAEEESAEALVDGWYRTGDLGYADDGGYLFLVDRATDMMITGGENVYSTEVERVLEAHPAVAQVAVIGIPHDIWGEQVHAVVVPKASVTADELIAFCGARIAAYKTPKSIELRAQPLPLSGAMKVLKHELRTTALSHRLPNDAPTR